MQLYAILRGAVFAESGYNLEFSKIAPDGLKKDTRAYFMTMDTGGKTTRLEPIPGCEGTGEGLISVPLKPYPNRELAVAALNLICENMEGARDGSENAKSVLGFAWMRLLTDGLALESQDSKTQIEIVTNAYGRARVHEQLNRFGTLAGFQLPDTVAMVDEALP